MRFRRALIAAAAVLGLMLTAACGGKGVDNLSIYAPPIGYIHGHFDLASAQAIAGGKPLRAALIWGAPANYVIACFKYPLDAKYQEKTGSPKKVCPDPFGFVPARTMEIDIPIDPSADGNFTMPIRRLPDASVAVGTDAARISWGSLIVAVDSNENGILDLTQPVEPGHGQFQGDGGGGGQQTADFADRAVAASFYTLRGEQQRLGFREAGWNASSYFYPIPGCAEPPRGFFTLGTPGMTGLPPEPYAAAPGPCSIDTLDRVVELTPLSDEEANGLACRTLNHASVRRPDSADPSKPDSRNPSQPPDTPVCLDATTLALIPSTGDCPQVTVMPLKGCQNSLQCQTPDWDLTSKPPDWWICN